MTKLSYSIKAKKFRKVIAEIDKKRDEGQTTPADIIRFDNILYGKDRRLKKWQLLDVYRPKLEQEVPSGRLTQFKKLPVIVIFHGGAWVYGDKDVYQFYGMRLAERGFAVVNYSYRLAPEAKFPASMIDTQKVFDWISENAEKYGFDARNVFGAGDSAGAHLLTMYAAALTNPEFGKNFPFIQKAQAELISQNKKIVLRGVALNCGKYTMNDGMKDSQAPRKDEAQMQIAVWMPHRGTPEEFRLIDCHTHVTKDFPPAFVMTCKGDFLIEQAPLMLKALEKAGVPHEFRCYGTEEMPLWHVFHCDPKLEEAVICNDEECNFFKKLCIM